MEQYELAPEQFLDDMKYCLSHYTPRSFHVRNVGSSSKKFSLLENLEGRNLEVEQMEGSLRFSVDGNELFLFEQDKAFGRSFGIGYDLDKRFYRSPEEIEEMKKSKFYKNGSLFRGANMGFLMELSFHERIPLSIHSLEDGDSNYPYYCVDRGGES